MKPDPPDEAGRHPTRARDEAAREAVEAVWRIESARLIAGLARITQDVGLAEEFAQAALESWPRTGRPPNPAGWLMNTAKNRAIDAHRRRALHHQKVELLGRDFESGLEPSHRPIGTDLDDVLDDQIGDDLLRLIFTACHPALSMEARVALTLRCLGGLSTEEIARAFLVQTTTMAARITRAKKALTEANVPFEVPVGEFLADRLSSVLEAVYLVFNEGYTATAGEQWARAELCQEAMRLGRMLAALAAGESETHALVAKSSRSTSRTVLAGTGC